MAQGDTWTYFERRSVTSQVTATVRPAVGVQVKIGALMIANNNTGQSNGDSAISAYDFTTSQSALVDGNDGHGSWGHVSGGGTSRTNPAGVFIDNDYGFELYYKIGTNHTASATVSGIITRDST